MPVENDSRQGTKVSRSLQLTGYSNTRTLWTGGLGA